MVKAKSHFYPVILAGGRGTRFWPLSRQKRAKQLLVLDGKKTMLQQTVSRLLPLAPRRHIWIIGNHHLRAEILRQTPGLPAEQVLCEPVARNTAPAIGLAAFILEREDPDAIIGLFPSDHVIGNNDRFQSVMQQAITVAQSGDNIVVLGVTPTRPETGYGYIEAFEIGDHGAMRVQRFTEKPDATHAAVFVASGKYYWNSGMFLWSARTLVNALREHLPATARMLDEIASRYGTPKFSATFKKLYPKAEDISIDYAVLEPRSAKGPAVSNIYCLAADFGWNDLGSWTALHEHHSNKQATPEGNLISSAGVFTLDATGNYVHAPGKFVAAVGVSDLVIVETKDALLITTRQRAQDVGKIVKHLDEKELHNLI